MNSLKVSDFDYELPEELIAQFPLAQRDESRMLVLDSKTGKCEIRQFHHITEYINADDCLVFNDTKVIPARIFGNKKSSEPGVPGAKIEALLLEELKTGTWKCMLRPGKRVKVGTKVFLTDIESEYFVVDEKNSDGSCIITFPECEVYTLLDKIGHIPLPPYIRRDDEAKDRDDYQTVFATAPGAVAAPTAGLHFTDEVLKKMTENGTDRTNVTLHVGPGTFKPVQVDNVDDHKMHTEQYFLTDESADKINNTKASGGRIFAVGTTSVRVLESCVSPESSAVKAGTGKTDIFLYPPYQPKIADCLLTNFHLPKSTLMMLVSCFAGKENIMKAYEIAIKEKFRFFSYGDCMLII